MIAEPMPAVQPPRPLEPTERLGPSRLLAGKYRLGRLIGEGGMGAVYEAEHVGLGAKVAVKVLRSLLVGSDDVVARFRREARTAAAVRHENVVAVTDVDTDENGVPYIVMELLEGETLHAMMNRERVLRPPLATAIVCQVLQGLAAAHARNVIHRDLKPSNVLLVRDRVKIVDFSVSKFLGSEPQAVTEAGMMVGTLHFMAPEQTTAQPDLDIRVDIYAAGLLLYYLLTGQLPFRGSSDDELIERILAGRFPPPRQLRPDIPEPLETVVLRAMSTRRDDRFADATAFRSALRQAMPDDAEPLRLAESSPAEPPQRVTVRERGRSRRRRRPWKAVLATAAVAALAASGWRCSIRPALPGTAIAPPALRFGVVRYLPEPEIRKAYSPFVEYMATRLGRRVELVIREDYVELAALLERNELDFAALSPYAYVRAKRKWPGLALLATPVTAGGASYEGLLLARADHRIASVRDLGGRTFCYVNPGSASGYLYPRAILRRAGMDPDRAFSATRFNGDHVAALRALYDGACDGAAVLSSVLFDAEKHGMPREAFRILASTDRIPYDAYCARQDLPPHWTQALRNALLALAPGSAAARQSFRNQEQILGFEAATDARYDSVRNVERYLDEPVR